MIKIYRYEKQDGGGPFCTKKGILRTNPKIQFQNKTLYGCLSKKLLKQYFKDKQDLIKDCNIVSYYFPENKVIIKDKEVICLFTIICSCDAAGATSK